MELNVQLRENPTTGYRWEVASQGLMVHLLGDAYTPAHQEGELIIGGGGTRQFAFSGVGQVVLKYRQSFAPDTPLHWAEVITIELVDDTTLEGDSYGESDDV